MANKRSKKNLTSNQANIISLIISAIYFICVLVIWRTLKLTEEFSIYYFMVICLFGTICVYDIFYTYIFKADDKRKKEREAKTQYNLSYTDFKEVYFFSTDFGDDVEMMRLILEKEGCKFYAKLTENKNIYLIVKDKYNEEVYNVEIENYSYFDSHFKFEK